MLRPVPALAAAFVLLLLVAACASGGGDGAADPDPAPAAGVVTDVARQSGIDFHHFIGATGEFLFPEIMGSGCALLDYDNDGDLDVYLLQGKLLDESKSMSDSIFPYRGTQPIGNRLYRNELISAGGAGGDLHFTDVSATSGAGVSAYAMGVATGDVDNDGYVDIYLTNFGPDILLRNKGDGTFEDITARAGLGDDRWGASASFFDYDRDGWLDLFVTAYSDFTVPTHKECFAAWGAQDYCNPKVYAPLPPRFYRNLGGGRFEDISEESGVDTAYGHGLGVVAADFDGNGWDDIYVANDGNLNQLWMNHEGQLIDTALYSGAALNEHGRTEAGMGVEAVDFDDDGDLDIFLAHLKGETNTLVENQGNGFFEDVTARLGLATPSVPFTSFGIAWIDLDHDADLDLFIANGDVRKMEELEGEPYPFHMVNQIMMNVGHRFEQRPAADAPVMVLSEVGRGAAMGDVDNDGDVDVLLSNNNGPARLLRNDFPHSGGWLELRIKDRALGRDAIGARVTVTLSDGTRLLREVRTDGSYLSAHDPRVHFAWPEGRGVESIEVVMPGGARHDLAVPEASAIVEVEL